MPRRTETANYDILRPEPNSLLQSARSFGYNIETAIADLIDNSLTAGASKIAISYAIDQFTSYVRIEDNGKGMSEKELLNGLRLGSSSPLIQRGETDLGRFGLGLKTASFSQCRRLTVRTRDRFGIQSVRCWDLDIVQKEKDWVLLRQCADQNSVQNLGSLPGEGTGTIVLWEKLDRLTEAGEFKAVKEHFYRKFENVRKHLGLIFHRFIEAGEVTIFVNGDTIKPHNPFHISTRVPTSELQEEQLSINGHLITIQPYILPHESKLTGNERRQLQIIKGWTEHQGIYLYRNRRLIADGTWLDLEFRKKESQRLCRIAIDIPNTLDKEWQIDVRKASAKIPDVIRKRVRNLSLAAVEKAVKVYTHRGAYIRRKTRRQDITYTWQARVRRGKRFYEVNREHPVYELIQAKLGESAFLFQDYMKLIGESLPVSFIMQDFSDPATLMKDFFEGSEAELQSIYQNTLSALMKEGLSLQEARDKAGSLDCFQQLKNL
ncbi:ATP-binding protein [Pontibacter actiniarum]|uniref:ATP-binding protein n=2 Tax=Pontibacter actiniarum TaxID=323450 RepID=A0A1X9YT24_9BACT|nr:ATP-binding protein [Pontibacter actiniarum]